MDDVDLAVAPGHRIGIVGPNGVGKTTLLQVLAGWLAPDSGSVQLAPGTATVGYLPQEPERRPGETAYELLARRTGAAAASAELESASAALAASDECAGDRYAAALERWLSLGAADLDAHAPGRCGPTSACPHRCSRNRW